MKKSRWRILGFLAFTSMAIAVCYYLGRSEFLNVTQVEVVVVNGPGQSPFMRSFVDSIDKEMSALKGRSIWNLDLQDKAQVLLQRPELKEVHLTRNWPNTLSLVVNFKEVRVVILRNPNVVPVLDDGSLLKAVPFAQSPDVPILIGNFFEKDVGLRKKALEFLAQANETGAFSKKTISEIHYTDKDGFWVVLVHSGIRVKLGQDKFLTKFARVQQVLEYLSSHNQRAKTIDANLTRKVLVH